MLHLSCMQWHQAVVPAAVARRAAASAVLALCAGVAHGQAPSHCAVIDLQGALLGTKEGKLAAEQLSVKVNPRKMEFEQRQSELDRLRVQIQDPSLTAERKAELATEIEEKTRRLDRETREAQEDLDSEEQQLSERFGPKLIETVNRYAAAHGLTIVFDRSAATSPVVFVAESEDITQGVIAAYDEAASVAASPGGNQKPSSAGTKAAAPPPQPAAKPATAPRQP